MEPSSPPWWSLREAMAWIYLRDHEAVVLVRNNRSATGAFIEANASVVRQVDELILAYDNLSAAAQALVHRLQHGHLKSRARRALDRPPVLLAGSAEAQAILAGEHFTPSPIEIEAAEWAALYIDTNDWTARSASRGVVLREILLHSGELMVLWPQARFEIEANFRDCSSTAA
jgi:hypothetical protein